MKTLVKMVAVLLILLVLATVAVALYIDTIAKTAIERGATYALGVETTLGSADVSLLSGTFSMGDLTVANPAGFESPHFTHLGQGDVKVALGTLRQQTIDRAGRRVPCFIRAAVKHASPSGNVAWRL